MTPLDRLFALEQFGIKLGLDNIRGLLEALDRPHDHWRAIHIAGTNGKGSVAAMVERGLRATGLRTGRYTSPHLDRIEERVAIDGTPVDAAAFERAAARTLAAIDDGLAARRLAATPTFFEATTAMAFDLFREAAVDVAVIEVGLGGRFDATNVVDPEVTAITSIALDHERHLGSTIADIAFEKAGIAKRGVPLVVGDVGAEALEVIRSTAAVVEAPIVRASHGVRVVAENDAGRLTLTLTTPEASYPPVRLALAGRHQAANAVVATRVLETWARGGSGLPAAAIVDALGDCEWPARLEWLDLPGGGKLLIDAAHNPAGAQALADYLHDAGVAPLPIVLAAMADKDVRGMVAAIAPAASMLVATTVDNRRARPAESLAEDIAAVAPALPVVVEPSPGAAVARAVAAGGRAVAAGSIFLIGPLRAALLAAGARRAG